MQLKNLREDQDNIQWAPNSNSLPVISWDSCTSCFNVHRLRYSLYLSVQEQASTQSFVLISGFIHDVSTFANKHPGGEHFIVSMVGKDATTAFFGGVYEHSHAAHNLLSMMRVGILAGGYPHGLEEKSVPPAQRLKITRYNELS